MVKIVGRADFSDQIRKIIVRYKRIGYNINIMRQSACLVFNPVTVNNKAVLLWWFLTVLAVCIYTLVQLLC